MQTTPIPNLIGRLRAILGSSFGCADQRCMAGSVLMGVGDATADAWRERVSSALAEMVVDNPGTNSSP